MGRVRLWRRVWGSALAAGLVALGGPAPEAWARGGGDYRPVTEVGVNFHTGTAGQSMTGALGMFLNLRAERKRGFFRPNAAMELQTTVGKASIGADTPDATIYGAGFLPGFHIFIFSEGNLAPFVGAHGVFTWHYLKLSPPPAGVEQQTQSLSYGFEASAGVDIMPSGPDRLSIRLRSGYWYVTSKLAGPGTFLLNGFRVSIGVAW